MTATGVFDARTDRALRDWQERNGLERTGVAAPSTWKKLWAGTALSPVRPERLSLTVQADVDRGGRSGSGQA